MANEYLVNSSDLTSVADAIREKGETSAQLVFPSGFVSAIENMKGGGADLNFEVVGGTTQPSNPKENTIWVNTSTAITSWAFSAEEPDSTVNGMVWIKTIQGGKVIFDAVSDENTLIVYPNSASQCVNGSWVKKDALIYQGGAWLELWDGYYLNGSDQYIDITGGWKGSGKTSTVTDEGIYVAAANEAAWNAYMSTSYAIDLSNVDYLEFEISEMYKYSTWLRIGVQSAANVSGPWLASVTPTETRAWTLDVSGIDSGYIAIQAGNTSWIKVSSIKRN